MAFLMLKMIILLTKSLININDRSDKILCGIEKVCNSAYRGKIFLLAETIGVVDHVFNLYNGRLSYISTKVMSHAKSTFSMKNGLLRENFVVIALVDNVLDKNYHRMVKIDEICDYSVEEPIVLGENNSDSDIFGIAARCYLAHSKLLSKIDIRCINRGGGGTTIVGEYMRLVKDARQPCLVVTDGDNNWPGKSKTDVSKECDKVFESYNNISQHVSLPVRDLENIIHPDLYIEALRIDMKDKVVRIKKMIEAVPELRVHGDFKEGISGRKYFEICEDSAEKKFLREIYLNCLDSMDSDCVSRENCKLEFNGKNGCDCWVVPSLGSNAISQVINHCDKMTPHKINELFSDDFKNTWLEIGMIIASWACAPKSTEFLNC